jgi:hypothetical protein
MRLFVSLCLISAAGAWAAPPQFTPRAADKQELYQMLDEIRAKIRNGEWSDAWRQSVLLHTTLARYTGARASPQLELSHLELLAGKDAISRAPLLARMAKTALAARDRDKAQRYADEALEASRHGVFPWTGDAIHQGNIVLGRLALERGDVEAAKRFLLLAGKAPGSSTLGSTGPNMALARDLLQRGESAAVLQYLEECGDFWGGNRGKLAEWTVLIRAGLKPDFGPNVDY